MGVYRKIRFLSIEAEISTLDDFLALFMNRQIILSQKMGKKFFRRKQLATLSQRSPVNFIYFGGNNNSFWVKIVSVFSQDVDRTERKRIKTFN